MKLFMTNDYFMTREHVISLLIVGSAVFLFFFFPVESFAQSLIVLASFLIIFPLLYTRFVLKKSLSHLTPQLPHFTRGESVAFVSATLLGVGWAFFLFFIPYTQTYIDDIASIIASFKGFILYELLIVLPVLTLGVFFSHTFISALSLAPNITLILTVAMFTTICISMLGLPLISFVFFLSIFSVYFFLRESNFYLIVFSFFIAFLVFGSLIAKDLLA